jgi:hypothetical protein
VAFAAGFVAHGALLIAAAATERGVPRGAPAPRRQRVLGFGLIAYAAVLYPLLGRLAGHAWPATPSFGVTPCPLTIVTIGLFLLLPGRVHPVLLIVPLAWAAIGGSAAVLLAVPQDWALPAAGLAGGVVLLRHKLSGRQDLARPSSV